MLNSNGSQWVQHVFIALFVFAGESSPVPVPVGGIGVDVSLRVDAFAGQCARVPPTPKRHCRPACVLPCPALSPHRSHVRAPSCAHVPTTHRAGLGYTFITNIQHSWQTLGYSLALGATAVQWVRTNQPTTAPASCSLRSHFADAACDCSATPTTTTTMLAPLHHHHCCLALATASPPCLVACLVACSPSSSSASGTSAS